MFWLVGKIENEKGALSMVELLVSLAIFSIVISALFAFLVEGIEIFKLSDKQVEAQRRSRASANRMIKEIRTSFN